MSRRRRPPRRPRPRRRQWRRSARRGWRKALKVAEYNEVDDPLDAACAAT